MQWEVGVIGLGTMGSTAMWQLAKRGVSVVGFEQFGIGHDRSAAGGETRLFRTAYKEGAKYVPILKEARKLWKQLEEETGKSLLTVNGGLTIGDPNEKFMQNVIRSVEDYEIDHEILDYKAACLRFPQHNLLPNEIMILDKEAGFIRPEYSIVSAVARAKELGANVLKYTTITNIEDAGDKVVIRASEEEYCVDQVIIAVGPWIGHLLPQYQPHVEVRKVILSWFAPKDISAFGPDRFPVFTRQNQDYKFYGGPTVENSMVKVGVSKIIPVPDVDKLNRTVELEEIDDNETIINHFFTGLYPDPVRVTANMEAYTSDHHSIIGRLEGFSKAIVLGGFSGHGFKMAPTIGQIAADIAMEKEPLFNIEAFSPNRFK